LDENTIPEPGACVILRENGNISTGGTARDCTEEIHPINALAAIKAAKAIGLDVAGIDMIAEDISVPINQGNGAVIEVNAAPGLRMHIFPTYGNSKNVAADILDMIYPKGTPSSIPIISISGTNGKTTTTRLIRHTFSLTGNKVGMTSTSGVYIGDECILKGDNTGPVSAKLVLSNKEVEVAVLETARGGIIKKGLGYDQADVGVIVNISDDHLGLDGLNTLEDLAFVKSLVIEAVKPDGYAVLNADDEMVEFLLSRVKSKVIMFSKNPDNNILLEHIRSGGKAVYTDGSTVYLQQKEERIHLIELNEIPITFGGRVECNIENSLAAISALYAMKVPFDNIKIGLMSFRPDVMSNPGRFNVFDMGNFKVMIDYSHNTAGYNAVINFIEKMDAKRLVGVIGMPGDRLDKNIEEVGKICSRALSKIYIKEDKDLRGREQGEVAQILYDAVLKNGYRQEDITIIHSEQKALESAMLDAQPGDLIIMFYEEFEPAIDLINKFKLELEQNSIQPVMVIEEAAG
ncbi:MAG: cphA, partial [Clostridiales bacterium]|nr:cphA [Clostridiales bacterium]